MAKIKRHIFRRVVFFICVLIYIGAVFPTARELYTMSPFFCGAEVLFYADNPPKELKKGAVFNGINYEIRTDFSNAEAVRKKLNICAQTVITEGDIDVIMRYLGVTQANEEVVAGGILISGYSSLIKGDSIQGGINVQIFAKENRIYVGNPVIFGSY